MVNEHDIRDMWPGCTTKTLLVTSDKKVPSVDSIQHGGDHYKKYGDLQPWNVILQWQLGYLDGTALKYIARWRDKNGVEDIKKAIHFLQKLVEVEEEKESGSNGTAR